MFEPSHCFNETETSEVPRYVKLDPSKHHSNRLEIKLSQRERNGITNVRPPISSLDLCGGLKLNNGVRKTLLLYIVQLWISP